MKAHILGAAWLLLLSSAGHTLTPTEFARGRVVDAAEPGIVLRLRLPADVYRWTARSDLGDMRVFNAANEVLPYALRRPADSTGFTAWSPLPLFALPASATQADHPAVNIQLGEDGTVVAVQGGRPAGAPASSYLLDASQRDIPISELQMTWPESQTDFVVRVSVEASDNLDRWRPLVGSATLASLATNGSRILFNRVTFPASRSSYLRVTQLDGPRALNLESVEARHETPGRPQPDWLTLSGEAAGDGYDFDSGGHFPVDRLRVGTGRDTYLLEAEVFSRADPSLPWQRRGRERFYQVAVPAAADGAPLVSDPLLLEARTDRYWRVVPLAPDNVVPTLEIGWLPHELLFVRQGEAPFRLAYGQAGVAGQPWPISELADRLGEQSALDTLPVRALDAAETLGGPSRLEPAPAPLNWTAIVLWGVLLGGVSLVALLAYRLLRAGQAAR